MNTICKLYLIPSLLILSLFQLNAQSRKTLTSDFKIGVNFSQFDMEGNNYYKVPSLGVHIGGNVNYKFYKDFQFQTGIFITKKGSRQHEQSSVLDEVTDIRKTANIVTKQVASYIQVPINLGYEKYFTKDLAFNVNAGMYLAYGFRGTRREYGVRTTEIGNDRPQYEYPDTGIQDLFSSVGGLSRFDYGANGSVGAIYDIYTLTFNYEYGLRNINRLIGQSTKNRVFSFSLGFRF